MRAVLELRLWHGPVLVGRITDAFCSDGTWSGVFERDPALERGAAGERIAGYIAFCADWNKRTKAMAQRPPEADEFERFSDIVGSGLWTTESADGKKRAIVDAPVFFPGGEVSWIDDDRGRIGG